MGLQIGRPPDSEATLSEGKWGQFEVHGHVRPFSPTTARTCNLRRQDSKSHSTNKHKVNKKLFTYPQYKLSNLGV